MDKRKQNQIQTNFLSSSQPRSAILSTQLSGIQSPNPMITHNNVFNTVKGQRSTDNDFSGQVAQLNKAAAAQNKVFNYEQQNNDKPQGTISGGYDLQPQYSVYSPFRSNEGRKEYHGQIVASQNQPQFVESAIRGKLNYEQFYHLLGRRIDGNDVVYSIGSQDSSRIKILNKATNDINDQETSKSPIREGIAHNLININTYQSQPTGVFAGLYNTLREKSNDRRADENTNFVKRKGSADSRKSKVQSSQGRSDRKNRGKSGSNSQSRGVSEKSNALGNKLNKQSANKMQRPNSAKNLKTQTSAANLNYAQRTMITSPTLAVLQREPSQQFLPPKPKPLRNQTYAKLPEVFYQSVGSHPITGNHQISSHSTSQNRVPSASSDRRSMANNKPIVAVSLDGMTFSPQRKKNPQMPTSGHKNPQSAIKKRGEKSNQKSGNKKNTSKKRSGNILIVADEQNLQNLSPNIGRIRPETINEEQKEDSWNHSNKLFNQQPLQSFDASEIKSNQDQLESQDSSMGVHGQKKIKRFLDSNIANDILKTIKQQIQSVNLNQEERKKKKFERTLQTKPIKEAPKEQAIQQQENNFKLKTQNIEQLKQLMNKKIENTTKNMKKKIEIQSQLLQQKQQEFLKQKKQEAKQLRQKEREERLECIELVKDAMKDVVQSQSTSSLSRKRDKSSQRPFSAKTPENQQLTVKVPPVPLIENPYEPVYDQKNLSNEKSPLREQKYELNQNEMEYQHHQKLDKVIKKQRQERSQKRKQEEQQEIKNLQKKDIAMKRLEEQYKKNFENYKSHVTINTKKPRKKSKKPQRNQDAAQEIMKRTSKSKKRLIDEEKENIIQSLSPQRVQYDQSRSGTKSGSQRKRKHQKKNQLAQAQSLAKLQQDVLELVQMNKVGGKIPNIMKKQMILKSQTVTNLHNNQELAKNQIVISKNQLQQLLQRKQSQQSSQNQSNYVDDKSSANQEKSYDNIYQSQRNPDNDEVLQTTPSIGKKLTVKLDSNKASKNDYAIKPSDSLNSFQIGIPQSTVNLTQSHENLMFKSIDKVQILPNNKLQVVQSVDFQSMNNNKIPQPNLTTKSNDVYSSQNFNSNHKLHNPQQQHSTTKSNKVSDPTSPIKSPDSKKGYTGGKQGSNKKDKVYKRKGSAGQARNKIPVGPTAIIGQKQNKDQQLIVNPQQNDLINNLFRRPQSASIKQPKIVEMIQNQQKVNLNIQSQFEAINDACIKIQTHLRTTLAKKKVFQLKKEKQEIEKALKEVKEKFLEKESRPLQSSAFSPQKSYNEESNSQQQQMLYNKSIQILKEEQKHETSSNYSQSQSSNLGASSKLSKSEANLKALIRSETEKNKTQRPSSSDQFKKGNQQAKLHQQQQDNESQKSTKIKQKVFDKIEQQQKLHLEVQEQNNKIKGFIAHSNNTSSHQEHSSVFDKFNLPDNETKNQQIIKIAKNLDNGSHQFDSLSSSNKLSRDIELQEELKAHHPNDLKDNRYLKNVMKEKGSKNKNNNQSLNRSLLSSKKADESQSQFSRYIDQQNSSFLGTDQKELGAQTWKFNRGENSFQKTFEINSRDKDRRVLSQDSASKSKFYQKIIEYEQCHDILTKQLEKQEKELKILKDKKHLSPASKAKKASLEQWVSQQKEDIKIQKKWINQNVDEMIKKIDQDIEITYKKIGSARKKGKLNASHDLSQQFDQIPQFNTSSIQSTPRTVQNQAPSFSHSSHSQAVFLENFNQNNENQRLKTGPVNLFEYKIPKKDLSSQFAQLPEKKHQIFDLQSSGIIDQSPAPENIFMNTEIDNTQKSQKQQISIISDFEQVAHQPQFKKDQQKVTNNVFDHNLANDDPESERQKRRSVGNGIVHQSSDLNRDSEIFNTSSRIDEDEEGESLSKQEPPKFQPSNSGAASPENRLKEEQYEEDERNAEIFIRDPNQKKDYNKLQIIPIQPEVKLDDIEIQLNPDQQNSIFEQQKQAQQNKNPQSIPFTQSQPNQNQQPFELETAFNDLKEPEQPLSFDDAKKMRDKMQEIEAQTEILTEYIFTYLMESMKQNLIPKRPIIPKSPTSTSQESTQIQIPEEEHDIVEEQLAQTGSSPQDQDNQTSSPAQAPQSLLTELKEKKKKLRGIKTTMRTVDSYTSQIFTSVRAQQDEFIENLSTPLNKDPLEILLHLQNVYVDSDLENAMNFQQSVLPVDLYLDIERNKQTIQIADVNDEETADDIQNKSMLGEWENIHNKVIFDAINEALDNYRPYGLRGPPMPWSQQTRTLTYRNGQEVETVLRQVKLKVMEWARTFAGALPCSELLQEYGIRGPLEEDKLNLLREERLAHVLAAEIEENEQLWTDYEYEETQTKLDVADMILEFLAEEAGRELTQIQEKRKIEFGEKETI